MTNEREKAIEYFDKKFKTGQGQVEIMNRISDDLKEQFLIGKGEISLCPWGGVPVLFCSGELRYEIMVELGYYKRNYHPMFVNWDEWEIKIDPPFPCYRV